MRCARPWWRSGSSRARRNWRGGRSSGRPQTGGRFIPDLNILVAIPCYNGICAETARSLLDEQALALSAGLEFKVIFLPGCSLITMARNQLAADFLASDATKLVFIDSDVSWEQGSVIKLASHKADFVGGAYRLKSQPENYPVAWLSPDQVLQAKNGLLEASAVPGGFMCLTKKVFARLRKKYPERTYSHFQFTGHAYFDAPYTNGLLYGEDSAFCHYWREAGGKIWLDPELSLTHHAGNQSFPGHIGNWLKSRI